MAEKEMSPPDTSNSYGSGLCTSWLSADDESEASTSTKNVLPTRESSTIAAASPGACSFPGPLQISYTTDISEHVYSKDIKESTAIPGNCGLYNLGNTCFMNAGLQSLLASEQLIKYCLEDLVVPLDQQNTLLGQFKQLVTKIWSGGYSVIHPRDFKDTLSLYHNQFQDYRQHDCQEFLALLLDSLHEQILMTPQQPTDQSQPPSCSKEPDLSQSSNTPQCSNSPSSHLNNNSSHWTSASNTSLSDTTISSSQSNNLLQTEQDHSTSSDTKLKLEGKINVINSRPAVINEKTNDSSDSTGSSTITISNISVFGSEDSNQSTVSLHSSDSEHANTFKTLNLKSCSETGGASAAIGQHDLDVDAMETTADHYSNQPIIAQNNKSPSNDSLVTDHHCDVEANNLIQSNSPSKSIDVPKLNNTRITSLASLEEYYAKDCKTLNTNMLFDDVLNNVNIDSDKFAKLDNRVRNEQQINLLEEVITDEEKPEKSEAGFGIKDTNLRADKKSRSLACSKNYPLSEEEVYSNIKRIKIDQSEAEKNVQMEEIQKYRKNKSNIRDDLTRRSVTPDSLMEVEGESSDEDGEITSRSSTVDDIPSIPPALESYNETDEQEADKAWEDYLADNNSVVVNSFQGQFKSTIVCSECRHVSVTFEPFMYLSLPIPRALERQMCVLVIRPDQTPTRYLLSMYKTDNVAKLRQQVKNLIGQLDSDIILAEVLDYHISRLLDDHVLLRYVNDSTRKIYAFEMMTPPKLPELPSLATVSIETSSTQLSDDNYSIPPVSTTVSDDVFSQMGTFSNYHTSNNSVAEIFDQSESGSDHCQSKSSFETPVDESSSFISGPDTAGTGMWEWSKHDERVNPLPGPNWDDNVYDEPIGPAPRSSPVNYSACVSPTGVDSGAGVCGIADQWKSCAICLEELADSELLVHMSCGGTFCDSCLERSMKHCSDNGHSCPICLSPASRSDDFIPLTSSIGHKPASRILAIPVCLRYSKDDKPTLFSHPNIVYLPSHVTGQLLYSTVNTVLPPGLIYSVLLTDGQGIHCSRCQYTDHCSGCVMSREGDVTLQPGDHLAVHVDDNKQSQITHIQMVTDHVTMNDLQSNEPTTIYDCFTAFTQCEILDEHNPWFCPQCRKNQCANKRMTVWRYPDTLIVHLKRFVFHEFSSTKIDNPVIFPEENLDLADFLSGPKNTDLQYDLYSVVCHFGGSNSGHYTSYTRHPIDNKWFYYNDETVTKNYPKQDEYSSGYVLFYQKQGTSVPIKLPVKQDLVNTSNTTSSTVNSATSMISATPDDIAKNETTSSQQCFDFYS